MNLNKNIGGVFGRTNRKIICLLFLCFPCFAYTLQAQKVMIQGNSSTSMAFTLTASIIIVLSFAVVYLCIKLKKLNAETHKKDSDRNKKSIVINSRFDFQDDNNSPDNHFYRTLLQSTKDGIVYYDKYNNIKYVNSAFFTVTGLNKKSCTRNSLQEKLHTDHIDFFVKKDEALLNGGFYERDVVIKDNDGDFLTLSTHSVTVKTEKGERVGALTIFRNITAISRETEEMLTLRFESKLKAGFLAFISHEIRTPLNSVVGFANLLLEDNLSKETKQEYIEHINFNSEKLLQIIGDIIDLSRLSSSQVEIMNEMTSLSELVNTVVNDAKTTIKRTDKPIILNIRNNFIGTNDMAFTDRRWLKRVLAHILDNAIKFTLSGSIDFIYSIEKDMIYFTVKDTGIGIDKENLARIFEEFKQEFTGHHRPFEGLGIGLTLAKEIAEKMGGEITVKSEKEIGSEFTLYVPYRLAETAPLPENTTTDKDQLSKAIRWNNKKCLLVNDNKDVLIYLKRILVDTGIEILTANSGIEAIELVKIDPYIDIILLDVQMSEMNGIETIKIIKELKKDLPVIAQTTFVFEYDIDVILEAGCDACLVKPIGREHLLTTMLSFIKSSD